MLFSVRWQRVYAHGVFFHFILVFTAARGLSAVAVREPLTAEASLVEPGLQARGLSSAACRL